MRFIMVLVIGVTTTACLSEGTRQGNDATTGDTSADTSADTGADTGVDTSADVPFDTGADTRPDADLCGDILCDDGDPCTYDQCNPATGQCEHYAVPDGDGDVPGAPFPGCVSDADCDDGNPCTTDSCVDGGGCGIGSSYCASESIPGCDVGCDVGCDDGNPCTTDACLDGQCFNTFEDGCLAECVGLETVPLEVLMTQGGFYPDPTRTTGEVGFYLPGTACNDGPTCDCDGAPALHVDGFQLMLRSVFSSAADNAWACSSSGCVDVTSACEPAHFGVRYRVWGRGLAEWELYTPGAGGGSGEAPPDGDPAVPVPPPMVAGMAVQDYCLETDDVALVGPYAGVIEYAGSATSFSAEIALVDNDFVLQWRGPSCPDCLDVIEGKAAMRVFDGYIEVDANLPGLAAGVMQTLRLYSNRNTLTGAPRTDGGGITPFIALPFGPRVVLTRLP